MFEFLFGKKKVKPVAPVEVPYVNPFKHGDRVELMWTLYNESTHTFRLSKEDEEGEENGWDIFQITLEKGKIGTVNWTNNRSVTVDFDGIPFGATVLVNGLKKVE